MIKELGKLALGIIIEELDGNGYGDIVDTTINIIDACTDICDSIEYLNDTFLTGSKKKKNTKKQYKKLFKNKKY